MDWSQFSFDFVIERLDVMQLLITIEGYREAALNLVMPADWQKQLDKLNRVRAVHGTTALEGNPLSEAEVSRQIDLIADPPREREQVTKEQQQIRNSEIAQNWVKIRFQPEQPPLSLEDLFRMHRTLTVKSDETNNIPGEFRTFSVVVGSPELGGVHKGAPHERLPKLMKEYIDFVNSRQMQAYHPVIRALLAHFFLVTIHPFGDGNGRISRLVEAGILYQGGYNVLGFYGLSNYFYRNEARYKTTLQSCRGRFPFDLTPFILFGLEGFASELKGINNFIKTKLNRVIYKAMLARAHNNRVGDRRRLLNSREWNLLEFLLKETEPLDPFAQEPSKKISFSDLIETPFVKSVYGTVTPRTFFRELSRLQELGFIRFAGEGKTPSNIIIELDFSAIGKY